MTVIVIYCFLLLLSIPVLYILMFALGSIFYKQESVKRSKPKNRIAIYIPAYKEDDVIVNAVRNITKQKYYISNSKMYDVIVIAQHLKYNTLKSLYDLNCKVIKYNAKNSTKVKALKHAISRVDPQGSKYDIAIILDADNHLEQNFLLKINDAYSSGFNVIQAHRTAKNINTPVAYLDAISEEINNSIFRKGFNFFGYSASIIGSGVAFKNIIFINSIQNSDAIAGFDREIGSEIVLSGQQIAYLDSALVYDEKVQKTEIFENQRTRWIESQIRGLKMYTFKGIKELIKNGNLDFFLLTTHNLIPPKLLLLGFVLLVNIGLLFVDDGAFKFSAVLSMTYIIALLISIPKKLRTKQFFKSMYALPLMFFSMVKSTLKLNKSKKSFIHTPHGVK